MTSARSSFARKGLPELLELACELRVVFTDMDGTLLTPASRLPDNAEAVIDRLQATGVRFVPTTGRTLRGVQAPFGAQAQRIGFVAGNGMDVTIGGRTLRHLAYDRDVLLKLARIVTEADEPLGMCLYDAERSYVLHREADAMRACSDTLADAVAIAPDELPAGPILKAAVVSRAPVAPELAARLQAMGPLAGMLDFAPCGAHWIDALLHGVDKADGVAQVLDALGATPRQALAFGDSMNDAGMMRLLPHGVAVANAMDALKELCAFEIGPNAEASVIDALDRIATIRAEHGLRA